MAQLTYIPRPEKLKFCRDIWERDKEILKCPNCERIGRITKNQSETSEKKERYQCRRSKEDNCASWSVEAFYEKVIYPHMEALEELDDLPKGYSKSSLFYIRKD